MKDSQSLRIPAASAAKVGMAAALAAGMAIATPTAAFAAGEDQDVSVASENASDSYYYIGDSCAKSSTHLINAAQTLKTLLTSSALGRVWEEPAPKR